MSTLKIDAWRFDEAVQRCRGFAGLFWVHLRAHWLTYVLVVLLWLAVSANYRVGWNETASLPQSLFIIHKGEPVAKGDYVAFTVPPDAAKHFKNSRAVLTKIVVGTEGDVVTVADRIVHVNGQAVGYAKTHSLKGEVLDPIAPAKVPFGYMYVMGLHRDSLDSRYTIVGLVPYASVVGRAHPVF